MISLAIYHNISLKIYHNISLAIWYLLHLLQDDITCNISQYITIHHLQYDVTYSTMPLFRYPRPAQQHLPLSSQHKTVSCHHLPLHEHCLQYWSHFMLLHLVCPVCLFRFILHHVFDAVFSQCFLKHVRVRTWRHVTPYAQHWHRTDLAGGNAEGKAFQLLPHYSGPSSALRNSVALVCWYECKCTVLWGSVWGLWATKLQWNVLFSRCCGCRVSIIPPALSILVHSLK